MAEQLEFTSKNGDFMSKYCRFTSRHEDFTKHWGFNDQYGWFMDDVYGSFGWDVFFWAPSEIRSAKRQDFRNKVMGTMRYPLVI